MGLDYTDGCVNFRDVGEFLNLIAEKEIFPEKKLFRGGSIDYIKSLSEIEHPKTIINLRNSDDYLEAEVDYYQFPMANKIEKYNTSQKEVRRWLNEIIKVFEDKLLKFPVFIHCLSGKDRTGIVVASILKILEVPQDLIIAEYLLSDGGVNQEWIEIALDGISNPNTYFNRVDLDKVKTYFTNP